MILSLCKITAAAPGTNPQAYFCPYINFHHVKNDQWSASGKAFWNIRGSFLERWQLLFHKALSRLLSGTAVQPSLVPCTLTSYASLIRSYQGPTWHPIIADCQDDLADLLSFYLIASGQRSFYSIGNQVREKWTPVLFHVQISLGILAYTDRCQQQ